MPALCGHVERRPPLGVQAIRILVLGEKEDEDILVAVGGGQVNGRCFAAAAGGGQMMMLLQLLFKQVAVAAKLKKVDEPFGISRSRGVVDGVEAPLVSYHWVSLVCEKVLDDASFGVLGSREHESRASLPVRPVHPGAG